MVFRSIKRVLLLHFILFSASAVALSAEHRLPDSISVTSQAVDLNITPGRAEFTGETTIKLSIDRPTEFLFVHNNGLAIKAAELEYHGRKHQLPDTQADGFDMVRYPLPQTIIGEATLKMVFIGHVNDADSVQGLFLRGEPKGNPYIFSQFQEMEARRVFPSLDEPSKKTSFTFTLNIPASMSAVHTTRPVSTVIKGARKIIEFAPTPRMNTDVLSLAVGNFNATPLTDSIFNSNVYSLSDNAPTLPADMPALINHTIRFMQDYLNAPFPYHKLDFFVAPLGTIAAMENTGLVALNSNQLPGSTPSDTELCVFRKLIAHEVIHMWFGNAITMQWYDDYWLNESFTEFFAAKVIQDYSPDNQACTYLPQASAFRDDNQTARPLKRSVQSRVDTAGAGQIYYTKGRTLLEMIEAHAGQSLLKRVFRQYVSQHVNGNVTTADFTGLFPPDLLVPEIVTSFTEQPGFPLVTMTTEKGQVYVMQQPFHNQDKQQTVKRWVIPLTIKSWNGTEVVSQRYVLAHQKQLLPGIKLQQPIFIGGNGAGYFRYQQQTTSDAFPLAKLSVPERLADMDNNNALAQSGRLNYKLYTDSLIRTLNELPSDSLAVDNALDALNNSFIELIPTSLQTQYARYIQEQLPEALPWKTLIQQKTGGKWLELYGLYLRSAQASSFARQYLASAPLAAIDKRLAVLRVVTSNSTIKQYHRLLALFETAEIEVKEDLLDALGYVPTPQHVGLFYRFLLSDKTKGHVIDYRFQFPAFKPHLRQTVADYIQSHRDSISQRIPDDQLQWFPYNFLTACSGAEANMVADAFAYWLDVPGLEEKLSIVLSTIQSCSVGSARAQQTISTM